MLDAVCTATKKGFVLLDIKLENFVRVTGTPDRYKAIDFDSAVKIGEDFSSAEVAVTYGYVSPEIAKLYLARASRSSVKIVTRADASSTVFSLGLILFELFNNLTPFWKTCELSQESEFLGFAANQLTNDIVKTHINSRFRHAKYYKLTKVLESALECNPLKRISARELRESSLFGDNVSINVRDIHVNLDVINRRITNVDENLADLTAAVRVEMAAHFDNINANVSGLAGSLIGSIDLSIEASPVLQQLLSLTKQLGDQFKTSVNKDDVIGNIERWVSRVNLESSQAMSQQLNELMSKILMIRIISKVVSKYLQVCSRVTWIP